MKKSVVLACVLLSLIAAAHLVRLVFDVSLKIAGDEVSVWVSAAAIVIFGGAAVLLWRDYGGVGRT